MIRKAFVTTALIALGIVSQATAQNHIYLTGSTAFRSRVFAAINGLSGWSSPPTVSARGGSHANGDNASYMLFHGTYNSVDTYVNCFWSGSEAGIAAVAQPGANPVYFLLDSVTGISSSQPTSSETNTVPQAPDLCMADTSQTVSLTPSPTLVGMGTLGGSDPGRVGVVTFTWAKNVQSSPASYWTAITDITDAQARQLLAGGVIVPALITGNAADVNNGVYCVGRNAYSGTHVNTMLETKVGISFLPQQYSLGGYPHSSAAFLGTDPSPLLKTDLHNDGYDSGGDVAKALSIDGSCQANDPNFGVTGWMAMGYLGMDDANNITNVNNHTGGSTYWVTLNGVAESDGAVEQGQYNYWGYEHMYGRTTISGYQAAFGNALVGVSTPTPTGIQAELGGSNPAAHSAGIALGFMQCSKSSDQADPAHN